MLKHPTFRTVALTAATGILAAGTVAGAALTATAAPATAPAASVRTIPGDNDLYQGQVIARTGLNIRARATTNSAVVGGPIRYGTVIRIRCKVVGQNVDGNRLWYKLADARYPNGYVAARYVDNIGRAPSYCTTSAVRAPGAAVGKAPAKQQGKQGKQGKQENGAPVG